MKKLGALLIVLSVSSTVFAAETCKPFLMSVAVRGSNISFSSSCIPGSDSIISMKVTADGKEVSVDSESLSSPEFDVKKAIMKRITDGVSPSDASIIVNKINPALQSGDLGTAKLALIDLVLAN